MVQIRYKGQNYLIVGKYRFNNGYTEVKDDDFYEMMKSPTFAYRVNQRILEVPKDFPLEKPQAPEISENKKAKEIKEKDSKEAPIKEVATKETNSKEKDVAADQKDIDSNKNKK